jgi:branched-chain amino acid transport system substrate-binding protein
LAFALRTLPWLPFASMTAVAHAAENKVVIGDIDDMSGLYADVIEPGGIEAAKMAIEDFGGSVLGNKIELMTADHQNKPDLGAQKFREWADRNDLTMVLGGSNTGVSIAMATIAKGKEDAVLRDRRCRRIADRQGLHALHRALRL